eukprot:gene29978-37122_t
MIAQVVMQDLAAVPNPPVRLEWFWQEPSSYGYFTRILSRAAPRAQYRFDPERVPDQFDDLTALFRFRQHLRTLSPHLKQWFLGGNSKKEALLYEAFDEHGPAAALIAVLREKERMKTKTNLATVRSVGFWNGEDDDNGASMGVLFRDQGGPCIDNRATSRP